MEHVLQAHTGARTHKHTGAQRHTGTHRHTHTNTGAHTQAQAHPQAHPHSCTAIEQCMLPDPRMAACYLAMCIKGKKGVCDTCGDANACEGHMRRGSREGRIHIEAAAGEWGWPTKRQTAG